jgi:hypothetical protein
MEHTKNITPSAIEFQTVPVATRSDGWTPERQRAFIEELADTGLVREAAARVGMSEQGARRLRRRPEAEAFSQAWDAAMRIGADRLRSLAYERAIEGTVRYRYYHGEVVGEERVFDKGQPLCREGELGDDIFLILAGTVEAWRVGASANERRVLGQTVAGGVIGEMAVLDNAPRVKDIVASNYAHLSAAANGKTVAVMSTVDNLNKGAAGGAVQWMNRLFDLPETAGLTAPAAGWT